jgi:hAT family C-terminal dimerisation region
MVEEKRASLTDRVEVSTEDEMQSLEENESSGEESFEKYLKQKGKEKSTVSLAGSQSSTSHRGASNGFQKELQEFDNMCVPKKRSDLITWWNEKAETLPILSGVALDTISIPVSEVSVERLFSHLKIILSKHRSKLTGPLLEDILFLRLNSLFKSEDT